MRRIYVTRFFLPPKQNIITLKISKLPQLFLLSSIKKNPHEMGPHVRQRGYDHTTRHTNVWCE